MFVRTLSVHQRSCDWVWSLDTVCSLRQCNCLLLYGWFILCRPLFMYSISKDPCKSVETHSVHQRSCDWVFSFDTVCTCTCTCSLHQCNCLLVYRCFIWCLPLFHGPTIVWTLSIHQRSCDWVWSLDTVCSLHQCNCFVLYRWFIWCRPIFHVPCF